MKMYNVSVLEATKILIDRYNLNIDIAKPINKSQYKEINERQKLNNYLKTYKNNTLDKLNFCMRTYHKWQRDFAPTDTYKQPNEKFIQALNNIDRVEYLYNELNMWSQSDIIDYFKDYDKEVTKYVKQCRTAVSD